MSKPPYTLPLPREGFSPPQLSGHSLGVLSEQYYPLFPKRKWCYLYHIQNPLLNNPIRSRSLNITSRLFCLLVCMDLSLVCKMKKKTNNTENRIIQPECTGNQRQKKLLATFPYPCRSWMTDAAVDASRPVVGSSRNKTDGDIINSIPILVRFRSPPEMPRMNSFPTCHSKSEINKGHGMLFFLFLLSGNVYILPHCHTTLHRQKKSFAHTLIGPLQFTITRYKNRHAGEQTAHWDIQNKRIFS